MRGLFRCNELKARTAPDEQQLQTSNKLPVSHLSVLLGIFAAQRQAAVSEELSPSEASKLKV